ncbi:MAG: EF-P lysine aminoacylase GenX [Deltaproteobacteria bacterium]|nr:EF-P lysine aminoacylase GenX [Deltaproteobacteria bacterium]
MRSFFEKRQFIEVETHQLLPAPSTEPHIDALKAEVALDWHQPLKKQTRFLHTSPELSLKRVLAGGAENVFSLARVFRGGELSALHLPEFTMLEWYRTHASLEDLQKDCLHLLREVRDALFVKTSFSLDDMEVRSCQELFLSIAKVDLRAALVEMNAGDERALPRRCKAAGHVLPPNADFEDAFFHVMGTKVEPVIGREKPCFVTRWPYPMAIFAKYCADDKLFADRFELYLGGMELANAFDEVTCPEEQRKRFENAQAQRRALGKETLPVDEDFLKSLVDLPQTAGIALGWDRLLMALLDENDIQDVQVLRWK